MIADDEHILFVGSADIIASIRKEKAFVTGFVPKKIVVTVERLLFFQSLKNKMDELQYELTVPLARKVVKASKAPEQKIKISVNQFPEISLSVEGFTSKVVIDEEPSVLKYLEMKGIRNLIKSVQGLVFVKNERKKKFYGMGFGAIKPSLRFAKALIAAQAWRKYMTFCKQNRVALNPIWIRILIETINNENSVVLIDPDLFATGSPDQIASFMFLINLIPFAHSFHHRYSITNQESAGYASDFLKSVESKTHSINLSSTHLRSELFQQIFSKANLSGVIQLDLSHNKINDSVFEHLQKLVKKGSKKLSFINLSHNEIKLANSLQLFEFFKSCMTVLHLDLSYNQMEDASVEIIQKFILLSVNPPIEELNLSHNKYSRKMIWRLYMCNIHNFRSHAYMQFIIYPIPIKREIFLAKEIDFPQPKLKINMNIHSALIEQFEQDSLLKHTFDDINLSDSNLTIKFTRDINEKVKIPSNKQQLLKTLQISQKIENFINRNEAVESIADMAVEFKNFPFEVPPVTRSHFQKFINEKFNEALFIRDHYSVRYLFQAIKLLQIPWKGYTERLDKLQTRNKIFQKRVENVFNFEFDETVINTELDQLVKESLRLYLEGRGTDVLYYLKYKRDQYIQRYLNEKLNPEHYLYNLRAQKSISADQRVSEKQFIVPYEIRLEKKINQNFYLHPWQADYHVLSSMPTATFKACLEFLQESQKKQKFALYFDRISERIEFIENQFTYFAYKKFRQSYSDMKINACRLIYLYNNIKETSMYTQLPIYLKKKKRVTPERSIFVKNPARFKQEYHISKYLNINLEARKANIYNYPLIITKYKTERFLEEGKKILPIIQQILRTITLEVMNKTYFAEIVRKIIQKIKIIVNMVRLSSVPEELKEQFYLHMIASRNGRYQSNVEVLKLLPGLTMYLKPPLYLEKFLVAAVLQCEDLELLSMPLCLASEINEPTSDKTLQLEQAFVERDWLYSNDIQFANLICDRGKIALQINCLDKTLIRISIAESSTVSELIAEITRLGEISSVDRENFWLYRLIKESQELIPFEGREHIGQIFCDFKPEEWKPVIRRRIYCREMKYNFWRYDQSTINSLYHDTKFQYLSCGFFVSDANAIDIASMMLIIDHIENKSLPEKKRMERISHESQFNQGQEKDITAILAQIEGSYHNFIPKKIASRLLKSKEAIIRELKEKVTKRMARNEHVALLEMKINFLKFFERHPEFCSTNYHLRDKNDQDFFLSINAMYIYISTIREEEYIDLQKIISIVPKSNCVMLRYHKHENLVQHWPIVAEEKLIFAISFDMLSYCSMRINMPSSNLYEIHNIQKTQKKIASYKATLKKVHSQSIEKELSLAIESYEAGLRKIGKMNLTLMQLKQLQYHGGNNYLRLQNSRKLYANKTERKGQFNVEVDEEEIEHMQGQQQLLQVIFPQTNFTPIELNESEIQATTRKQRQEQSLDYHKEHEQLNKQTAQKRPPEEDVDELPPLMPITKDLPHISPPSRETAEVVTNAKPRDRPPPRRRNR